MGFKKVPDGMNFDTEFDTYVIAYSPDAGSFFVTNQRFWFWQTDEEFDTEEDGIKYFENNIDRFIYVDNLATVYMFNCNLSEVGHDGIYLENTQKYYKENK